MWKALNEMMRDRELSGEKRGIELGAQRGEKDGIHKVNQLNKRLMAERRWDDLKKASSNLRYQRKLFEEYKL